MIRYLDKKKKLAICKKISYLPPNALKKIQGRNDKCVRF